MQLQSRLHGLTSSLFGATVTHSWLILTLHPGETKHDSKRSFFAGQICRNRMIPAASGRSSEASDLNPMGSRAKSCLNVCSSIRPSHHSDHSYALEITVANRYLRNIFVIMMMMNRWSFTLCDVVTKDFARETTAFSIRGQPLYPYAREKLLQWIDQYEWLYCT